MVPASWSDGWSGGAPPDNFMAVEYDDGLNPRVQVHSGVCSGADTDLMLCIYNVTPAPISVETGDVLAVARSLPVPAESMFLVREGGMSGVDSGSPAVAAVGPAENALGEPSEALDKVADGDSVFSFRPARSQIGPAPLAETSFPEPLPSLPKGLLPEPLARQESQRRQKRKKVRDRG